MKKVISILVMLGLSSSLQGLIFDGNTIIPGAATTASALDAGKMAMEVVSENIANQYTTRDSNGEAYKAKYVTLEKVPVEGNSAKVKVSTIERDSTPGVKVYNPGHPHADEDGFVEQSNVQISQEMVKMMQYTRWIEAQYAVANASVKMVQNALAMGR